MAGIQPEGQGQDGADGKGPDERAVGRVGTEELCGADDAPEDRAVEVDSGWGRVLVGDEWERKGGGGVLPMGQVNPFIASGVQRPGMWTNIQLRTPIWVREEMMVATICTAKRMRGGIFM